MTWPVNFGNLFGGNQQLSLLDQQFQQTAQMLEIPCSASGATAISLTPLVNCPVLTGYTEFCAARFRAAANSGAGVTAQVNGLGFLPVYRADGVTQCGLNDLVLGFEYVVRFSQALGGGVGGWFLEAPAFGSPGTGGTGLNGIPGGRLTLQSGVPVMSSTVNSTTIYYAPYVHPFVPIYNGSSVQMYQYTAGLADTVGLSYPMANAAVWPNNNMFDVFATLVGGAPVLCTVQWTSLTARATGLAVFGGMLTNAATTTARTNSTTTITLSANQGSYLGTFNTVNDGQAIWLFGTAASGGGGANLGIYNYYNQVLINTIVTDNGAPYTYTSGIVRPGRGSFGNAISFVQGTSERAAIFTRRGGVTTAAALGAAGITGIGVSSAAFNENSLVQVTTANAMNTTLMSSFQASFTGLATVYALESSDGSHANTFDNGSNDQLIGSMWL